MLEIRQTLNLKLQQSLVMTPQLQQAIRLLQLNRMELLDAISAELEQNPALEEEIREDPGAVAQEALVSGQDPQQTTERVETDRAKEVSGSEDNAMDIDWQQWLEQYNSAPVGGGIRRDSPEDVPNLEQTVSTEETLYEHLVWQLNLAQVVDADRRIALEVIGALDENGFLVGPLPTEDIAIRLGVSVDHVERVLGLVQGFEPGGIAARSITECLQIQLRLQGNKNALAEKLVAEYLPELEKRNYQAIAKKEEVELQEVGDALKIIQRLDPRPARNFGGESSIYITPDIYVYKIGDQWVIVQNEDGMPMLRVSKYYRAALSDGMNGSVKNYVQEKLRSAQWLIRSIHQRQRTIYRVMESILKFQARLLRKRDRASQAPDSPRRCRGHRHARVDDLAGYNE